jgi:hypothetical protein
VAHVELRPEAGRSGVELEAGDGARHGVPVDVPDGRVDTADELGAPIRR